MFEYLYSQPNKQDRESGCSVDPLSVASNVLLQKTVDGLELTAVVIEFYGCTKATFKTGVGRGRGPRRSVYKIYYPVGAGAKDLDFENYLAPIVHEIGHIYQSEKAGSFGDLKLKYCTEQIELGADFLAGFAFANVIKVNDLSSFQQSLQLLGDYADGAANSHARPPDRTAAFRMGYFVRFKSGVTDVDLAYQHFLHADFFIAATGAEFIVDRCNK
jgi:hypothetical protein